ncbi:MAG: pyridoxamine 5'-phosphate oxidase family protein [Halobacteriota archaeon]
MVKMPEEVMEIFNDWDALKAVATADAEGKLNVAPIKTFSVVDEETLAFGYVFPGKTKDNMEATKKVAVTAFKGSTGYQIKGTFQGFLTSGPIFDEKKERVKEKLKLDAKGAGIIKVEEVYLVSPGPNAGKKLV